MLAFAASPVWGQKAGGGAEKAPRIKNFAADVSLGLYSKIRLKAEYRFLSKHALLGLHQMKTIQLLLATLLCASLTVGQIKAQNHSNIENYAALAIEKLTSEGFILVMTRGICYIHQGNPACLKKCSVVLSGKISYNFKIISLDSGGSDIICTLYDSNGKALATNYYLGNKFTDGFTFECMETGLYRLDFIFNKSKKKQGALVWGFKR